MKKLQHGSEYNGYWYGREWPYSGVTPKVFAEPYMEDEGTHELRDYKLFAFNGEVKLLLVALIAKPLVRTPNLTFLI